MRRFAFLGLLLLLASSGASAEIVVSILSMPAEVYSFEPIYVLFEVKNEGSEPIYLPAEDAPDRGVGVYVAPAGAEPKSVSRAVGTRIYPDPVRTMWLAPGERWLFLEDVGWSLGALEGSFSVQAVLSSRGRCGDEQVYGKRSFSLESRYLDTLVRGDGAIRKKFYRCWAGEARSAERALEVRLSRERADLEAQTFLIKNRGLVRDPDTPTWYFKPVGGALPVDWWRAFPSSHYTYAHIAKRVGSVWDKSEALAFQPENSLSGWVALAAKLQLQEYRSSCWQQENPSVRSSDVLPKLPEITFPDAALPPGGRELLEQHAWYLESRHCPRVLREAKPRHD